jgi:hypothetical protein
MLLALGVGRFTTTCAVIELASLFSSVVEAFVEVHVWEVGVASTVSVKEAHRIVPMASW